MLVFEAFNSLLVLKIDESITLGFTSTITSTATVNAKQLHSVIIFQSASHSSTYMRKKLISKCDIRDDCIALSRYCWYVKNYFKSINWCYLSVLLNHCN